MKRNYHTTEQKSTKTKDLNHKQTQNTECNTKRTSRAKKTPNTRQKAQYRESQSISEVALKQLSASPAAYFFYGRHVKLHRVGEEVKDRISIGNLLCSK